MLSPGTVLAIQAFDLNIEDPRLNQGGQELADNGPGAHLVSRRQLGAQLLQAKSVIAAFESERLDPSVRLLQSALRAPIGEGVVIEA